MGNIEISIERFQELVAIEAGAKALVNIVIRRDYVCKEDILCAIGTKEAMLELERQKRKKEERAD